MPHVISDEIKAALDELVRTSDDYVDALRATDAGHGPGEKKVAELEEFYYQAADQLVEVYDPDDEGDDNEPVGDAPDDFGLDRPPEVEREYYERLFGVNA
jgi:hypothetical protein